MWSSLDPGRGHGQEHFELDECPTQQLCTSFTSAVFTSVTSLTEKGYPWIVTQNHCDATGNESTMEESQEKDVLRFIRDSTKDVH